MDKQKRLCVTNRRSLWVSLCVALTLITNIAFAQNINIKGKVTFAVDNEAVLGATVMIDGTQNGTTTNIDGEYTIANVAVGSTILVSYIGYKDVLEGVVATKTEYNITIAEDASALEEVVVVGYGTMRKKEVTGAVVRVDAESITKLSTSDVGSALQGQIAGVNVQASSGQPGAQANVQIRGISSVSGTNTPLYVVDGVPFESDPGLSPQEIQSIDVLKDAASAAIYGTRGAGGVILITTKGGKEGDAKVSIDLYHGLQKITSGLSLVNSTEYIYLQSIKDESSYLSANRTWTTLWNSSNMFVNNSDLISVVEQDNQPITSASITISGGSKNLTYSVVGSYFNQEGVVINSGYEKFNVRANSTFKKDKWTLSANVNAVFDTQESPAYDLYYQIYQNKPIIQQVDPDASITTSGSSESSESITMGNVLAKFKETNVNDGKGLNINFSANYDIMEGLAFNTRFASGYKDQLVTKINPLFEIYDSDGELVVNTNTRSGIREEYRENGSFSWESMLNYAYQSGKHDLKATAVFSMEQYTYESFYVQRYDLISNDILSLGAATSDAVVGVGTGQWGQDRTTSLVGMLGRVQYNYDGRYLFSASLRRDGSSRFAKENRWGYFPSASAGWNVSEEEFWKPLLETIDSFKIRASYGTTGNQNFTDYTYAATVSSDYDYAFGGTSGDVLSLGSIQTSYANAQVKWETTEQINLGVDFSVLNSRLTLTADVYQSSKNDMLFPLKVPPVAGTGTDGTVTLNVGDMENKGVEFAARWRDWKKGFNYWVNTTVSRNVNTVTKMSGSNKQLAIGTISTPDNDADDITYICEGMEAGAFMMMPTDGIVNTDSKLQEYQKLRPDAQMGDLMYVDTNGDGELNDSDRVYCGSGAPEVEIGLNAGVTWKGIDFSMNWYASLGNEIVNGSKIVSYQQGVNRDLLYSWSLDNTTSTIATYNGDKSHYNYRAYADIWVEDGSFLRLRNVTVGYTLPKDWMSKARINKLRFYVAADNLLTFTKYDGYDPEVGNDGLAKRGLDSGNYPISSQIRGGIQIEF